MLVALCFLPMRLQIAQRLDHLLDVYMNFWPANAELRHKPGHYRHHKFITAPIELPSNRILASLI
ncbi:hypothetical protein O9929_05675 [Vibrio lentus]|nr:hypothetical protein [Vibrio lentus]